MDRGDKGSGYFDFEQQKARKNIEYAQTVKTRHVLDRLINISFDDNPRFPEIWSAVLGLGFAESGEMQAHREQLGQAPDFEAVRGICTAYRIEAERLVEQTSDGPVTQALAQIRLELAIAALYLENNQWKELEDFFYDELSDAEDALANLLPLTE